MKTLLLASAALAALPACAFAQVTAGAEPQVPSAISEVVVTATRSPRVLNDVPESVSVVTAAQIEGTPAKTIDDVLRRAPSVNLPLGSAYQIHPTAEYVSMRGLSGMRALVLLDGAPLEDPFFGYVQWTQIPLETVDRVEVVRGGGATLWGDYAMGGVINILTRPIDRTELVGEAAGGSYGSYRSDGHAAYAGKGFGLALDAGVNHSDGYVQPIVSQRGPITAPTSFTAHTFAVSGDLDITPTLSAQGRVSYFDNDENLLTRLQTNFQRTWRYTGNLTRKLGDRGSLVLTLFHDDVRFTTYNTSTPSGATPIQAEYIQNVHHTPAQDTGVSLVWSQGFDGWLRLLSAGVDYHGISGTDYADILGETGALQRTDVGGGDQRFLGGFVQAELRPIEALQVLASLRYQDFYNYDGRDRTPGGQGANVPSRHDSDVDPRLSVRYTLGGGFALRGAYYRAFHAPQLGNLYRAFSVPYGIFYGNPALRPETLEGGEIGFDVQRGGLRFQATGYTNTLDDLIISQTLQFGQLPAGFFFGARQTNAASARSRGAEAELDWRISPALHLNVAYTYADSVITRNPADPASVGVQQPFIPEHSASAGLDWTGPWGIKVSPRVRYVSSTNGDSDGLLRTEPHFVADLAGSVPLTHAIDAFVQIENLFDRRYVGTNDGYSAPLYGTPLTAMAGVRVHLR